MADSLTIPKNHTRSNSFPTKSHPLTSSLEDHLCKLKTSEGTSSSVSSLFNNLVGLKDLHECVNDYINLPSTQQALSNGKYEADEVLDRSLRLLDVCAIAKDVLLQTKECKQELQSSLRRKRGENSLAQEVGVYMVSRKRINKTISKCLNEMKKFEKQSFDRESELSPIVTLLKEVETISFTILKPVLSFVSGEKATPKQSRWSIVSKFMKPKDISVVAVQNVLKQSQRLEESSIEELEEGLESIFRCLVKTRVSLLNILNQ